jgi:pyruvate formate lyase activating enzyme
MKELRRRYLHVAMETTGYGSWEHLRMLLENCDLVLYDLKIMNEKKHREYTGVSNTIICENAEKISALDKRIIFRVPLIGGVNDEDENIDEIAGFAEKTGVQEIHLLPYHRFGESKYAKLDMEYNCSAYTPDEERVAQIQQRLASKGLSIKIGG